jgi:uncharacterized protein (TIGR02246 family)
VGTQDEKEIGGLVEVFVEGWNASDGEACARPFAEDADFVAISGLKAHGRDLIARGHAEILSTVFRGTQLSATVESIRFVRPDVAVADVTMRLRYADGRAFMPGQYPGYSSAGLVVAKDAGRWSIIAFRNLVPFGRPVAGPLEQQAMREQGLMGGGEGPAASKGAVGPDGIST